MGSTPGAGKRPQRKENGLTTEDWGDFDGPALLFGGPVSNLQALAAVLAQGAF